MTKQVVEMDKQTKTIKRRYERIASVYDVTDYVIPKTWRRRMLRDVHGKVLEVGVGTGANLAFYPEDVDVTGIDVSSKMLKKAFLKAEHAKANVALGVMDVQHLGFADNTFDFVVSSLVFCTVPDPVRGLREIRRVVKPDGKVIMLEHMRSENEFVGKLLDVLNPLTLKLMGENINRRTMENLAVAGFNVEKEEHVWTSLVRMMVLLPEK